LFQLSGRKFGAHWRSRPRPGNNDVASTKALAKNWWEGVKADNPADYYQHLFSEEDPEVRSVAAEGLLRIDKKKYLPFLSDAIANSIRGRQRLLAVICSYLGPGEEEVLKPLLKDPDPEFLLGVADALWKQYRSLEGAKEILARISRRPQVNVFEPAVVMQFLELCESTPKEFATDSVCELLKHHDPEVRYAAMIAAPNFPEIRVAEGLAAFLEDPRADEELQKAGVLDRRCDIAIRSLCLMLDYDLRIPKPGGEKAYDAGILEFKSWWAKAKPALNWRSLQEKAALRTARTLPENSR
jgi:hypothetical protein